ncbi:hypothetical protein [Rhizobium halophilum]|uniref:hypothetical protein n=1 Tax=Rhizobium halophilum TaxID=2846852 RepID=UPI001EFC99BA|nr:hypothetical protein [Rhizobium halophilum]MCF6371332.1 hypothetical protein [Rhizobium halophilum]
MSLDAVASGRWQVGALVSFAGLLPPVTVSTGATGRLFCLCMVRDDRTIPAFTSSIAAGQLSAAGFQVELELQPTAGHTISPKGADRALTFLQKTLSRKPATTLSVSVG